MDGETTRWEAACWLRECGPAGASVSDLANWWDSTDLWARDLVCKLEVAGMVVYDREAGWVTMRPEWLR